MTRGNTAIIAARFSMRSARFLEKPTFKTIAFLRIKIYRQKCMLLFHSRFAMFSICNTAKYLFQKTRRIYGMCAGLSTSGYSHGTWDSFRFWHPFILTWMTFGLSGVFHHRIYLLALFLCSSLVARRLCYHFHNLSHRCSDNPVISLTFSSRAKCTIWNRIFFTTC